jgi:hypothetical protein
MSPILGRPGEQTAQSKLATDVSREVPAVFPRKRRNLACRFDVVFMSFDVDAGSAAEIDIRPECIGRLEVTGTAAEYF